jgi:hypothetical protein
MAGYCYYHGALYFLEKWKAAFGLFSFLLDWIKYIAEGAKN